MKKIIYLHQYFCRPTMNGGVRSYEFAKRLAKDGYDVHIVTSDRDNAFQGWKVEEMDGFTVHWISVLYNNRLGFLARIWAFIRFSLLATLKVIRLKGNINFATSTPLTIVIPVLISKFFCKTPYLFEVRDLWPEIPIELGVLKGKWVIFFAKHLAGLAYKYADKIIALSPDMFNGILKYGDYGAKTILIPNASDVELLRTTDYLKVAKFWQEKGFDCERSKIIVYTGTLGRVNRVGYLAELAALVKRDDVLFVVFGDGAEKERIIEEAIKLGVWQKNFFLCNPVSKKDLAYVLGGAVLSVSLVDNIPALWGNSANKFFDAFAAGIPIAINHGGWQADVIVENQCGVVLNYDHQVSLAVLLSFLDNSALLARAKESSANLGDNVYSRDVLYQKLKTAFSEVKV